MKEFFNKQSNDDQLKQNLDYLDEIRNQASQRMIKYQQKMAKYYNQRIKLKRFNIEDLVLRKVTPATKDPAQGKDQTGKDPTRLSTTLAEEVITYKIKTGTCYLVHGTWST